MGFGASVAHHLDLGGGAPGLNIHASDVYQEGIRFPPSRYSFEHDWNGGSFERLVTANVRVPDLTIGDFNAQFAANAIGVLRVKQLCERYGADKVEAAMAEMQDYSERRVRAAIAQAPKGTFYGEDAVDDDGLTDDPLVVKAKVTIAEDSVEIDFEGTCAQVKRNLNCPYSSTLSAALSLREVGADQPGHSLQRGHGAADHDQGAVRLAPQPAAAGAGARAHDPGLSRVQRRDEGDGAGAARQGDRHRLRLHDRVLPLASSARRATASISRSSAAATAPRRAPTAATPSIRRSATAPTRRSNRSTSTTTSSASSATSWRPIRSAWARAAAARASPGAARS